MHGREDEDVRRRQQVADLVDVADQPHALAIGCLEAVERGRNRGRRAPGRPATTR